MRFARLAAFALWLIVALLAVAGFAAFTPETAPTTTTSTTVVVPQSAGTDWGTTSGRVVAFAFGSGLRSTPGLADPAAEDALIADLLGERPEVTPPTSAVSATSTTTTSAPNPGTVATVTTSPPATSRPVSGRMSEAEVRAIISVFFAPEDVELALKVSYCESRWEPGATNPSSGAAGLFQQIPRFWAERSGSAGWAGADIYDVHANTAVSAWLVYEAGGWKHWTPSRACWR